MEFNFNQTLALLRGGLLDHKATWQKYLDENPSWQKTATTLAGPLVLANVVLTQIFGRLSGSYLSFGMGSGFLYSTLSALFMTAVAIILSSLIFGFLAGTMGGRRSYPRAFAGVSLAIIPAMVAGIVAALIPGFGFLLLLAGGVLSLYFLYQVLPLALDIPDDKRVVHFIVGLVSLFIINAILVTILGVGNSERVSPLREFSGAEPAGKRPASGMMGELERQAQLMEAAGEDVYEPPNDGRLTESQVQAYVKVMQKTRALHEQYAEKMKKLSEDMDKDDRSAADLAKVYSGIGSAMSVNNAEMEIVKTAGANWAEHQWVATALRTAMIQQGDGSEAIEHNFSLYQAYRDQLE